MAPCCALLTPALALEFPPVHSGDPRDKGRLIWRVCNSSRETSWSETYARCVAEAPEAFESDRLLNLFDGRWQRVGGGPATTSTRSTVARSRVPPRSTRPPRSQPSTQRCASTRTGRSVELDERKARVTAALDAMAGARDLLALLLCGRSASRGGWRLRDVDRASTGVRVVRRGDRPPCSHGRTPLPGPVQQHRQLELPDERADARRCSCRRWRATPSSRRAHRRGAALPDAAPRVRWPPASPVTRLRVRAEARRGAGQPPGSAALGRVGGRVDGRIVARSLAHRKRRHVLEYGGSELPGASGSSTEWPMLARRSARRRLRQATVHRLPALSWCNAVGAAFLERYPPGAGPSPASFGHPLAVARPATRLAGAGLRARDLRRKAGS